VVIVTEPPAILYAVTNRRRSAQRFSQFIEVASIVPAAFADQDPPNQDTS
jgi:hypothetical protein